MVWVIINVGLNIGNILIFVVILLDKWLIKQLNNCNLLSELTYNKIFLFWSKIHSLKLKLPDHTVKTP